MKVLLFANTDWYLYNYRLTLAQSLRSEGYDVLLLSPPGRYSARLEQAGFTWLAFPLQRKGTNPIEELAAIFRLIRIFRKHKPDIAHFFTIKPVLYGSLAAKLAGVPHIVNAITGLGTAFSDSKPGLRSFVILFYRLSLRGTKVIFQNPEDLETFLKYGLVDKEQAQLIPGSGVDVDLFCPSPEPSGEPVVMLAGRLLRSKGVPAFAAAAKILQQRGFNARFALVGEPYPDNPETIQQKEIDQWQKEGSLEIWGWHDDMEKIIPQASIVCLPSTYKEGLPRILLEAGACQRPVIATDIPGCRLAVRDGETGLLIPPDDLKALTNAIESLLKDPARRRAMGNSGRKHVEQEFSLAAILKRTMQMYREFGTVPQSE